MLFNSLDFAFFLPIIFIVYWIIPAKNISQRNFLLLIASYIFYGWWDYRFVSLIIISSVIDYYVALRIISTKNKKFKKFFLLVSIFVNLGFLGLFKYYNFFIENFINSFSFFGYNLTLGSLDIILPVGISFYTFQTLSYTIDVYKGKMEPTKNILAFFSYVSFFPQLVAGPIERAKNLLPQFFEQKFFNYRLSIDGLRQILWGLFKKIVIADSCALYVNDIFNSFSSHNSLTLYIGAILFAFQIYCDFSGYSDIAIGTAKLFGFKLMKNFNFPYFSRDIAEFWRRWHISLSSWFKDYVYIPLGGSRGSLFFKIRNVMVIFILSGFWHGANWTFIAWGFINAVYFLPLFIFKQNRNNLDVIDQKHLLPTFREFIQICITFFLTTIAWIIFRSDNIENAIIYISRLFNYSLFSYPDIFPVPLFFIISLFIIIEWFQRDKEHGLDFSNLNISKFKRYFIYYILIAMILFNTSTKQEFIYFQF